MSGRLFPNKTGELYQGPENNKKQGAEGHGDHRQQDIKFWISVK